MGEDLTRPSAVILAAGGGSRLGAGIPKCLLRIGGRALIDHQLEALSGVGVKHVLVIAGYRHELVQEAVEGRADVIINHRYAETNSLYSFAMAQNRVAGPAYVLNSDVLFPADLLDLLRSAQGSALAFDSSSGALPEEMKVEVCSGRVVRLSKTLPAAATSGENIGVVKLDAVGLRTVFAHAAELIAAGELCAWFPAAVTAAAAAHPVAAVDVSGLPWTEIDFPHDLVSAWTEVLPHVGVHRKGRFARRRGRIAIAPATP